MRSVMRDLVTRTYDLRHGPGRSRPHNGPPDLAWLQAAAGGAAAANLVSLSELDLSKVGR